MATAAKRKVQSRVVHRHALFVEIIGQLAVKPWHDLCEIAKEAEVSPQTLYNWVYGETVSPLTRTLFNVAEAMGYRLKWERIKQARRLRVVK